MNTLVSVRTNIIYSKVEEKDKPIEYKKYSEIIFLVDKPKYTYSNEGEVVREPGLEELRFTVSEKAYEKLISLLLEMKNIEQKDLK